MDYSVLKQYYSKGSFINFSVKYVVEGVEHYNVNGTAIHVESGQYLIAGPHSKGSVMVDSETDVKGICVALSGEIISEVVAGLLEPGSALTDPGLDKFFSSAEFPENKYRVQTTRLGNFLAGIGKQMNGNTSCLLQMDKAFYYTLAEHLVADHQPLYKPFNRLKAVRSGTRKDLFRRLLLAKDHMDASFMFPISIGDMALSGGLSEYHFFRLFKSCFAISPYQYILHKRLRYSYQMLMSEHCTVSDAAVAAGYGDIYSFSKAFKRKFGFAPSKLFT